MESPPKRMTRSRAAAKATEPSIKTTKVVTPAARARSTATASTKSTAAKRKTRADENDEEEGGENQKDAAASTTKRATRGRPRKMAESEESSSAPTTTATITAAAAKPTRGRPKKAVIAEPEAPKTTARGRAAKKVAAEPEPEPVTRATRTRASATAPTKASTKKTVTFQEPDKENIEPTVKKATGIRGRPAKRGAATGTTTTTATTKTQRAKEADQQKKPLSPKKVTQIPLARGGDESEDELAASDHESVPLMKMNPVKPPKAAIAVSEQQQPESSSPVDQDSDNTIQINNAILNPPDLMSTAMASPARRPPSSPFKEAMKSPARKLGAVPFPGSALKANNNTTGSNDQSSPTKSGLLQSAARRPPSPIKGLQPGTVNQPQSARSGMKTSMLQSPAKRAMPGFKPLLDPVPKEGATEMGSPTMKTLIPPTPTPFNAKRPSSKLLLDEEADKEIDDDGDDDVFLDEIENIKFPGRLSAVLPREADPDPALEEVETEEAQGQDVDEVEAEEDVEQVVADDVEVIPQDDEEVDLLGSGDETEDEPTKSPQPDAAEDEIQMSIDVAIPEQNDDEDDVSSGSLTPPDSPAEPENPMYQLRPKDLNPCDGMESDSEDDTTMPMQSTPTTSSLFKSKGSRRSTLGFGSLADQLGAWSAGSPAKPAVGKSSPVVEADEKSPMADTFFEDEMSVRPDEPQVAMANSLAAIPTPGDDEAFDDVMVLDEDLELAQEANDMSIMGQSALHDDGLSDDSQEYGDENEVPIDPAMSHAPTTPVRPAMKTFNTTTKVPLKPADNSTPSPLKKRSFSASRIAPKRPSGGLNRNATVISYSPTKERRRSISPNKSADISTAPVTPSKTDVWSTMGTPARTPRKDIDPALLRGAVVFVDVHTSEGADASGIFVELLTQMGARCVKTWHWNPNSSAGDSSSNKIGITHVVYKDGGKRTLEKVRQTDGVVQCVGVSWVLDCERENEWLDESTYYIDTKSVPRGGARRRKSMEPKALANMNGTLVDNGSRASSSRESMGPPATPMNRRQSTVWMHTPTEEAEGEEEDDIEWSQFLLTPVPKTPAPEAVAKYAAEIPETPGDDEDEDMEDSPTKQTLLTRTCPPKSAFFHDLGKGILGKDKDEQVLMRLMAARRKSLQFAPKVGSPLSKTWK